MKIRWLLSVSACVCGRVLLNHVKIIDDPIELNFRKIKIAIVMMNDPVH